jgi:LemA protein
MGKYILGCLGVALVGLVLVVIVAVLTGIGTYNSLVTLKQGVDSQWAEVQNQYQRRSDLVPNLVQTVSGAANFEKSTLIAVTDARASVGQVKIDPNQAPTDPAQLQQYQAAQSNLGSALSRLLVVSENYPDLKSNQNFLDLQAQLEGTENRIATARNHFNDAAQGYNTAIQRFPTVFFAGMMGFTSRPYFQAVAGSDVPPTVKFDFNNPTNSAPSH